MIPLFPRERTWNDPEISGFGRLECWKFLLFLAKPWECVHSKGFSVGISAFLGVPRIPRFFQGSLFIQEGIKSWINLRGEGGELLGIPRFFRVFSPFPKGEIFRSYNSQFSLHFHHWDQTFPAQPTSGIPGIRRHQESWERKNSWRNSRWEKILHPTEFQVGQFLLSQISPNLGASSWNFLEFFKGGGENNPQIPLEKLLLIPGAGKFPLENSWEMGMG